MLKPYVLIKKSAFWAIFVLFSLISSVSTAQTANNSVTPYTGSFKYGVNAGYFKSNWTDQQLGLIASQAGAGTYRLALYDYFLEKYGLNVRTSAFSYYATTAHLSDNVIFLNGAAADHLEQKTYPGCTKPSNVFANLYDSIWVKDASGATKINPQNYYAQYVYNVVSNYGAEIKFYEVWNEPDFSYSSDSYALKGAPGNWYDNVPPPNELPNLSAPVFSYIRMLRITYEVLHKYSPGSYVCTGGIGYLSFLDACLRYTDNPDGGKVTSQYPLTGGAYFDVLSFHDYPVYEVNPYNFLTRTFDYNRYSDACAEKVISNKTNFQNLLTTYGYGASYPAKPFIMTETNVPMTTNPLQTSLYGNPTYQRNYLIKMMVEAQQNGIGQVYIYQLGQLSQANPTVAFDINAVMGLYNPLDLATLGTQTLADEGKGMKTISAFLNGYSYDAAQTSLLKLPSNLRGAAFSGPSVSGQVYRYILWARTTTDESEQASGTYSFPSSLNLGTLKQFAWDAQGDTTKYTRVSATNMPLTGDPIFLAPDQAAVTIAATPPKAIVPDSIQVALPTNSAVLDGSASSAPANSTISAYSWSFVTGPAKPTLTDSTLSKAQIGGLVAGLYKMKLIVTATNGLKDTAQENVRVSSSIAKVPPVAVLPQSIVNITLPVDSVLLDATKSTSSQSHIVSYNWLVASGPTGSKITNASSATTEIGSLGTGTYLVVLKVTDANGLTDTARLTVHVSPANTVLTPPTAVVALSTLNINLPTSTAVLDGTQSTSSDSHIVSFQWQVLSGPDAPVIVNPGYSKTQITYLNKGVYQIILKVTDANGLTDTAHMTITVSDRISPTNQNPKAVVAGNINLTTPSSSALLDGSQSSSPDSKIVSYNWQVLSGPTTPSIVNDTLSKTQITGLAQGVYTVALTVTDANGLADTADMTITVSQKAGNPIAGPTAVAPSLTINSPLSTAQLNGSQSSSATSTIIAYQWVVLSGPNTPVLQDSSAAVTKIAMLIIGTYKIGLTVTDANGLQDTVIMTLTVAPANSTTTTAAITYQVYPNPTSEVLTLKVDDASFTGPFQAIFYDITGKMVKSFSLVKSSGNFVNIFNISGFNQGIYIMTIQRGTFRKTFKIIKN